MNKPMTLQGLDFNVASIPKLVFGPGRIGEAATLAAEFSGPVLLVTGQRSFEAAEGLTEALAERNLPHDRIVVQEEPTPAIVDEAVAAHPKTGVVIAVGGGAAIDAGKAISAMLPDGEPVRDFLEGVGTKKPNGRKVPFIACPTTAGTGAEATKNAVLSEVGPGGFKKSLRHDRYIPDAVVIDPALAVGCGSLVTAACGMDALTQLLEAFVSDKASPMTDALARSGLQAVADSLQRCFEQPQDLSARGGMAWAAFCSGICLAHAGLGVVHGFASTLGGLYAIPHGVVCGTLLPAATEANVRWLIENEPTGPALKRFAEVGRMFGLQEPDDQTAAQKLIEALYDLKKKLSLPPLGDYGIGAEDHILDATGLKNNPALLGRAALRDVLIRSGAVA
ncbi:MAG: iron-containing alcohol dehydrogenase [Phycisphaeraceae bacterium]|nr:iron-containing alcohol dehydrogenase [Phycisphaeraceae bacterium]